MKLLILTDDFPPKSFGGAGIIAYRSAKAFSDKGHEVRIVTISDKKELAGKSSFDDMEMDLIYSSYHERWRAYLSLYNPFAIKEVKRIIEDFKPDIVHAHNIHKHLSYHSLRVAKQSGAKVFLTAHDVMSFSYGKLSEFIDKDGNIKDGAYRLTARQQIKQSGKRYNPLRNHLIKRYLKNANKIFAVSSALKKALNENGLNNYTVIHNGIKSEDWQSSLDEVLEFRKKFYLTGKKVVLFGGRLSAAKGAEAIIKAMKIVNESLPDVILLVIGKEDIYAQKIKVLAKDLGILKNIVFTGWISGDELKAAYAVSDLVSTPSIYLDPFPTINLEAMACGRPVIGTCFGGTPEVVDDGVTGYIVNPFKPAQMAEKILELLKNPKKAQAMGNKALKRVKNNFSIEKKVKEINYYYEK